MRIGINGFGRIGRLVVRAAKGTNMELVGINDLTDAKTLAHLFKYDSVHGKYDGDVHADGDSVVIDGKKIKVTAERDPAKLPWKDLNVDVVLECTGIFRTKEEAQKHINAGAKKVLISAPAKGHDGTFITGINDDQYDKEKHHIISIGSCTTNCLAPLVKVMLDNFGIQHGFMTTIHSYTNDQQLLDLPHSDLRRARAAAMSMIPTSTGAAKAIAEVIPELKGKMDGCAVRVPTPDASLVDLAVVTEKDASVEAINGAFKKASNGPLADALEYTEEPLVSVDIIGNRHGCVFDSEQTAVNGKLVKVFGWYDNEYGFCCRMVDMLKKMM